MPEVGSGDVEEGKVSPGLRPSSDEDSPSRSSSEHVDAEQIRPTPRKPRQFNVQPSSVAGRTPLPPISEVGSSVTTNTVTTEPRTINTEPRLLHHSHTITASSISPTVLGVELQPSSVAGRTPLPPISEVGSSVTTNTVTTEPRTINTEPRLLHHSHTITASSISPTVLGVELQPSSVAGRTPLPPISEVGSSVTTNTVTTEPRTINTEPRLLHHSHTITASSISPTVLGVELQPSSVAGRTPLPPISEVGSSVTTNTVTTEPRTINTEPRLLHHSHTITASSISPTTKKHISNLTRHGSLVLDNKKANGFADPSLQKRRSRKVRNRLVQKHGECNISLVNIPKQRRKYFSDIFTTLVDVKWRWCLLVFALGFILSWLFFSVIYYLIVLAHGDIDHYFQDEKPEEWEPCIAEVRNYGSVFIFSVVTQHTIGYGRRYPTEKCPEVIILMCLQAMIGVLIQTLMAGVVFAKLARPKRRAETLIFSKNAVICMRDGGLCLLFRVGDMRRSQLAEAHIRLQMIKKRITAEGPSTLPLCMRDGGLCLLFRVGDMRRSQLAEAHIRLQMINKRITAEGPSTLPLCMRDGGLCLLFRVGDMRRSQLAEAHIRLQMIKKRITAEGPSTLPLCMRDGGLCLLFRVGDMRRSQLAEAHIRLQMIKKRITAEGPSTLPLCMRDGGLCLLFRVGDMRRSQLAEAHIRLQMIKKRITAEGPSTLPLCMRDGGLCLLFRVGDMRRSQLAEAHIRLQMIKKRITAEGPSTLPLCMRDGGLCLLFRVGDMRRSQLAEAHIRLQMIKKRITAEGPSTLPLCMRDGGLCLLFRVGDMRRSQLAEAHIRLQMIKKRITAEGPSTLPLCMRDGGLCLLFRVGDMRRSQLAEAHIRLQMIKKRITAEGPSTLPLCMRDGGLCLLFRVGDMRRSQLAEAHIRLQMIKKRITAEGPSTLPLCMRDGGLCLLFRVGDMRRSQLAEAHIRLQMIKKRITAEGPSTLPLCMRDGGLCLLFRVGDMRRSQLAEAHIRLQMIKKRITAEGELLPFHQYDMNVGYDTGQDRIFVVWPISICHVIDENSPLYNVSAQDLQEARFEIIVILEGVVQSTGSCTQAKTSYLPSEVLWGHRFEKLVTYQRENGEYRIDFSRFHNTYPINIPTVSAKTLEEMQDAGLKPEEAFMADRTEEIENEGETPYATIVPPEPVRRLSIVPTGFSRPFDPDTPEGAPLLSSGPSAVSLGQRLRMNAVSPDGSSISPGRKVSKQHLGHDIM